ncbi:MAG: sigma-70 family RNA polymerase sigma factor [Gemmataceae bacterium]
MQASIDELALTASDADLLSAFAASRNEEAFTELVRRHSPLVLGTCQRLLGRHQDAEDAAQAVFLTLARQAGQIDGSRPLAGWLHRVAWHQALDERKKAMRRDRHEQAAASLRPAASPPPAAADWQQWLDQELERLPESYRLPFILHHLDGMTKEETARALSVNAGTVSTRLHRARQLLRARLERRGLAVALASLAIGTSTSQASSAFVAHTAKLACAQEIGQVAAGAFSATLSTLVKGITSMGFVKFSAICVAAGLASMLAVVKFNGTVAEEIGLGGVSVVTPGVGSSFAGPCAVEVADELTKLGLTGKYLSVAAQVEQVAFVRHEKYVLSVQLAAGDKPVALKMLRYSLVDGNNKEIARGTLATDFTLKAGAQRDFQIPLTTNPSGLTFKLVK